MNRIALYSLAALLALAACKSSTGSDTPPFSEDTFDQNSLASYTPYTDNEFNWRIQDGALIGTGPADQSVLIRNGETMTDGSVDAISSRADDGGLVLRFRGPDDYYLLAFRDDAAPWPRGMYNLALYHHVSGEYREIAHFDVVWPRGTLHEVSFQASGAVLQVWFDNQPVGSVTPSPELNDPAPYVGPGGFGVRHYGADPSWITRFESFRWHSADPPAK
jgi:hypothetical protein